jgi:hypothetical protein
VCSSDLGSNFTTNTIISSSAVIREEIDPDIGLVEGTETIVGMTYCYSNHFNGIRIVDNFIKVGTDVDGIDFFINRWQNVAPRSNVSQSSDSMLVNEDSRFTINQVLTELDISTMDIRSSELVYFQVSNGIFRLSYEIINNEGQIQYVDVQSGRIL